MNNTVRYTHFGIGAGRCTIAYRIDNNRENRNRVIEFGMSFCSPKDKFSKNDTFRRVYEPIVRGEDGRPLNLETRSFHLELVHKGGRTLALEHLNDPLKKVTMSLCIPTDQSTLEFAIDAMQNYAFDCAPGWKNKTNIRKLRSGAYELSRDGYTMRFADPNTEDLVTLRDEDRRETYYL